MYLRDALQEYLQMEKHLNKLPEFNRLTEEEKSMFETIFLKFRNKKGFCKEDNLWCCNWIAHMNDSDSGNYVELFKSIKIYHSLCLTKNSQMESKTINVEWLQIRLVEHNLSCELSKVEAHLETRFTFIVFRTPSFLIGTHHRGVPICLGSYHIPLTTSTFFAALILLTKTTKGVPIRVKKHCHLT